MYYIRKLIATKGKLLEIRDFHPKFSGAIPNILLSGQIKITSGCDKNQPNPSNLLISQSCKPCRVKNGPFLGRLRMF